MTSGKKIPAPEKLLAAMRPGEVQAPSELAKQFNTSAALIRPVLEQMADSGTLARVRVPRVCQCNFIIAGTEARAASREKYVGIPAAPRTHFVMTGDLDGYMSEIRRRADLCMMVRR